MSLLPLVLERVSCIAVYAGSEIFIIFIKNILIEKIKEINAKSISGL